MKKFPKIDERMQEELLVMLKPRIKKVLYQTSPTNRDDLEQEIMLLIIKSLQKTTFQDIPTFFDLLEAEKVS